MPVFGATFSLMFLAARNTTFNLNGGSTLKIKNDGHTANPGKSKSIQSIGLPVPAHGQGRDSMGSSALANGQYVATSIKVFETTNRAKDSISFTNVLIASQQTFLA